MITHFETNKVYLAKGLSSLQYADIASSLLSYFSNLHIDWDELPYTQSSLHIWSRDYMPVQVNKNKFVCFSSYL